MKIQFALFTFALLAMSFSIVHPAQSCNATYQCSEGYCINSTCTVNEFSQADYYGACNKTADCEFGFCYKSKCTNPKSVTNVISIEPKNGCTGFIEFIPGGIGTYVCDFMWVIFLGAVILAGFFARGFGIIALALSVVLPLVAGLFVAPIAGVVVGVVEIIFFIWRRKTQISKIEKKEEVDKERKREIEILDAEEPKDSAVSQGPSSKPPKENEPVDEDLPSNWVEPEPIEPIKK